MADSPDLKSRRELVTRLVPYMALSAIKLGIFSSPLSLLANAATNYNKEVGKTMENVNDILPLLPGVEKLKIEVVGTNAVALVLQRRDLVSCAEQYLVKAFKAEGSDGAPAGPPTPSGDQALFDYILRLPSRMVCLKVMGTVSDEDLSRLRNAAQRINPAEVWVFADRARGSDERLDPVFVSENKVMRGRLKVASTADMLYDFFDRRFVVEIQPLPDEAAKVTLKLTS